MHGHIPAWLGSALTVITEGELLMKRVSATLDECLARGLRTVQGRFRGMELGRSKRLRTFAISTLGALALVLALALAGCTQAGPIPNIDATVESAVATAVANQPTPTPALGDTSTPEATSVPATSILLIDYKNEYWGYTKLQAITAQMGIRLSLGHSAENLDEFTGVLAMTGDYKRGDARGLSASELLELHSWVKDGGRLTIFALPWMSAVNPILQDSFGILVAMEDVRTRGADSAGRQARGESLLPLWAGLIVGRKGTLQEGGNFISMGLDSYFEPLDSRFEGTTMESEATMKRLLADCLNGWPASRWQL